MIEISEKLAANIPFVRIDLYEIKNKIYFGEMTFYPSGGFEGFNPEKWDNIIEAMHAKRATVFRLNQALLQRLVLPENALNVKEELERFDEQQSAC